MWLPIVVMLDILAWRLYIMLLRTFNQVLCARTRLLQTYLWAGRSCNLFSSEKDKQPQQIAISAEQLQHIKKMIKTDISKPIESDSQAAFFSNQETQLSLQLMQITAKEQLKPFLLKYTNKKIHLDQRNQGYKSALAELVSCKFIILYKFINLGGNITDKQIQQIYQNIAENVNLLREAQLTIFFRIIAAEIKSNVQSPLIKQVPAFPIIQKPSHTNSELVSLLLMVYPMNQDKIYINYHLWSKIKPENYRQGIEQSQQQIIYDPVHLLLMLKHFFYYPDVQSLVKKCFEVTNIDQYYVLDQLIKTEEQFLNRKVQALCFALNEGFDEICSLYLFKQRDLLKQVSIKHAIDLLKNVLTMKNGQKYDQNQLNNTVTTLFDVINNKQQALVQSSQDQQLMQNENYKNVLQILSIILAKKSYLTHSPAVLALADQVLSMKGKWMINFEQYSCDQLFNFIVCYKGWKDLRASINTSFDNQCALFRILLSNFREELLQLTQIDHKQLFYVCYFADSFGCLQVLKCDRTVDELKEFSKKAKLNKNSLAIIKQILQKLEN